MANFAFPELHPKVEREWGKMYSLITLQAKLKAESENLILLTQTKTDSHGRRHSVAIPLIPPPDGEKFEGGYHIERNPITGGARLVVPAQGRKRLHNQNLSFLCLILVFILSTNSHYYIQSQPKRVKLG